MLFTGQLLLASVLGMCALITGGHIVRVLTQLLADDAPRSLLEHRGWVAIVPTFGDYHCPSSKSSFLRQCSIDLVGVALSICLAGPKVTIDRRPHQ